MRVCFRLAEYVRACVYACVCVRACVCACVRVFVCVQGRCARVCVGMYRAYLNGFVRACVITCMHNKGISLI